MIRLNIQDALAQEPAELERQIAILAQSSLAVAFDSVALLARNMARPDARSEILRKFVVEQIHEARGLSCERECTNAFFAASAVSEIIPAGLGLRQDIAAKVQGYMHRLAERDVARAKDTAFALKASLDPQNPVRERLQLFLLSHATADELMHLAKFADSFKTIEHAEYLLDTIQVKLADRPEDLGWALCDFIDSCDK